MGNGNEEITLSFTHNHQKAQKLIQPYPLFIDIKSIVSYRFYKKGLRLLRNPNVMPVIPTGPQATADTSQVVWE